MIAKSECLANSATLIATDDGENVTKEMFRAKFTMFTGNKNNVAKGYDIVDGNLTKVAAENFYHGSYKTVSLTPEELVGFIKSIKQGQFLTSGINLALEVGNCPKDACRTSTNFAHNDGPGLLVIDGDALLEFGVTSTKDFVQKLRSLDPAMKSALIVTSPSASSGIKFKDLDSGLCGLHCFMMIDDAKAVPSILELLHKRSVLKGLARAQVTSNGTTLIKSIIDLAMKSSNQSCFEGGARLLNLEITQQRKIESYGTGMLCTSDFKKLSADQITEYEIVCAKLKSKVEPEANLKRTSWRVRRESELIAKGVLPGKAKELLDQALNGGNLSGAFQIHTDTFGIVAVSDILADPTKYHNGTCADPMDPEYGQNKAKIYSLQTKPCINSMAHGGVLYYLYQMEYTRADLHSMIETTNDFDELTVRIAKLVAISDLLEAERDMLLKAISKKAKISTSSLKLDAKSFQKVTSNRDMDHISTTQEVITHFGNGNVLHVNGFVYLWRGDGVWKIVEDREVKKVVHEVANCSKLNSNAISSILDMVKTEINKPDHRFDLSPKGINCLNGELIFENGEWMLEPHVREHYRTVMIQIDYDPNANAPRFTRFLEEVFDGDADSADKINIVLEALGYTLISSCHLEKFIMLIGGGANGKSVLLGVLAELIGRHNVCAVQPSQFENRFQRGHLQGKLANIITEMAVGADIADAQLKSLTSGEMTTAEHKHKNPFDFIPYAKHWFGTNHLPHTRDFSEALFRRAIILTFNNKFNGANRDVHLIESLKAELPGIFNMALSGLKRLNINNTFTECSSATQIAKQWKLDTDQVEQFVEDECCVGFAFKASSKHLFSSYLKWASSAGIRYTLSHNKLTTRIVALGYASGRGTGGQRLINGLTLRNLKGNFTINIE